MNKNKVLLLDRDGVINADTGYIGLVKDFSFLPGVFPFLRAARDFGYRFAVTTNQAGVAYSYYSEADFRHLTDYMLSELRKEGIEVELVLACFEHVKSKNPDLARQSFWRKPRPGMVLEAIHRLSIDPARSAFLGNEIKDMQAALGGGIRRCMILTQEKMEVPKGVDIVKNYDEALTLLKAP
ncbi:MAG: HAD-IIIA family hydrolase [Bdellovibrionales bacterium]|jgi:D-glycero-D-manno-heptose 1,7-bisphosphate phosphatase